MGVYYSSNPNWKPKNEPNAQVIYTDKSGKTTGKSSGVNAEVPKGVNVGRSYIDKKTGAIRNVGDDLAKEANLYPTGTTVLVNGQGYSVAPSLQQQFANNKLSPQQTSQQAQDASLKQSRANVNTQREAIQRDKNYVISPLPSMNEQQNYYASGTAYSKAPGIPKETFNPFAPIEKPKHTGFQFGDIESSLIYGSSKSAGGVSYEQSQEILSKGNVNLFGKNIPIPGLIQYEGIKLAKLQRNSRNELIYEKQKDAQNFYIEQAMSGNDFISFTSGLASRGIKTTFDTKTTTTENGGTLTEYSNVKFSSRGLDYKDTSLYDKALEAGVPEWKVRASQVSGYSAIVLAEVEKGIVGGAILKGTGVIGAIGRGSSYLWETGGAVTKTGLVAGGTLLTVGPVASETYGGYKEFKSIGQSGLAGAGYGFTKGVGQISGFMTGATDGDFLFVPGAKIEKIGVPNEYGTSPTTSFSLGGRPIITKSPEGWSLGYGKLTGETFGLTSELGASEYGWQASGKTEVNFLKKAVSQGDNRLFIEELISDKGYNIAKGLSGVKIKEVNTIPFEKSGVFENLGENEMAKVEVKNYLTGLGEKQKGWTGFKNAVLNKGLDRVYGSSTISTEGGFDTNIARVNGKFGDFDLNFRDKAIPEAEKLFGKLKDAGADVKLEGSLIELKNPKTGQYEHAFDFHGADTPDLQMNPIKLGIKGVGTKQFGIESGKTIGGQQLRQSLVDKGSATLQLRINKNNQFYFSPPDYRVKDVTDFVSISEKLNAVKGGNKFGKEIESFKNVLQVAYPDIKFGGESKLLYGGLNSKSTSGKLFFIPQMNTPKSMSMSSSNMPEFSLSPSISNSRSSLGSKSDFSLVSSKLPSSLGKSLSISTSSPSVSSFSPSSFSPSSYSPSSFSPSAFSPSPSPSPSPTSPSLSPSPSKGPSKSPSLSPPPFGGIPGPIGFPEVPSLGGYAEKKPKRRGRKSKEVNISPSFTAIVKNIKMPGPLKVSKTFGVTPFQTRGLLVGKKAKGPYYKLTDI